MCKIIRKSILTAFFISLIVFYAINCFASVRIGIPTQISPDDLLLSSYASSGSALQIRGTTLAYNNLGSIWSINDDGQPSRLFDKGTVFAVMEASKSISSSYRGWRFEYGNGLRNAYEGNTAAGQLWVDLHASGERKSADYSPVMTSARVNAAWYGLGRDFPIRAGDLQGTGSIFVRRITDADYLSYSLAGQMTGEDFSGMLKITSSHEGAENILGQGWSVDAHADIMMGSRWRGRVSAESLLGEITWHGLSVDDGFILSPRVIVNSDGFLKEVGGDFTGAHWHEDLKVRLSPSYRLDLIRKGSPDLLLGVAYQSGIKAVPDIGLMWPQTRNWAPFLRLYPTQRCLEIGAVGRGWMFRISGDDWVFANPKHAEIALTAGVAKF